ncbi:MAG: hypothetical protein F4120_08425 [Rhodothermaceae bacterium]|nr:hypothetical protein [Rhodothermaceae bacterium]MYC04344.1 hypothetical protein [Rhodothermaceae bacterium]MYI17631.1 hypothetical protein [Rhodothermaceae bacterium]
MRLKNSDNIPLLQGNMLKVSPWIDESSEGLDGITISEVRPNAGELRFKGVSKVLAKLRIQTEKTLLDPPGVTKSFKVGNFAGSYFYGTKGTQFVHPRVIYPIPVAPKEYSVAGYPSSFSRKSFSNLKSNEAGNSYLANRLGDRLILHVLLQRPATKRNIFANQIGLSFQINNATHHQEIFDILDRARHQKIAKRLKCLHETVQEDDPEDSELDLMSLRKLALFFTDPEISLPDPGIVISHDGFLQAEWHSSNAAALMHFLPDGNIEFAATGIIDGQDRPQDIHGTREKESALDAVRSFII